MEAMNCYSAAPGFRESCFSRFSKEITRFNRFQLAVFANPTSSYAHLKSSFLKHSLSLIIRSKKCSKWKKQLYLASASTSGLTWSPIGGTQSPTALWTILLCCASAGQILENKTDLGGKLGAPLITMGISLFLSNARIIPFQSGVYDMILTLVMPMAVALSLLETDIHDIFGRHERESLVAFALGAIGTIVGTIVSFSLTRKFFPSDEGWKVASCLCSSYIGGSVNFAATAQALAVGRTALLSAVVAMDNFLMVAYFGVLAMLSKQAGSGLASGASSETESNSEPLTLSPVSLTLSLAMASIACQLPTYLSARFTGFHQGYSLCLTAIISSLAAIVAGQLQRTKAANFAEFGGQGVNLFAGSGALGKTIMLLFFAMLGATAGIQECFSEGWKLFSLAFVLLAVHLGVTLFLGKLFRLPLDTVIIASNANVGGPATAVAMAESYNWPHLTRSAMLTGTVGYVIGTAVGCLVGTELLLPMTKL